MYKLSKWESWYDLVSQLPKTPVILEKSKSQQFLSQSEALIIFFLNLIGSKSADSRFFMKSRMFLGVRK